MGFNKRPTPHPLLITFCGLSGAGKTTTAKQLAKTTGAIPLNSDDWMAAFGVDFFDEDMHVKLQLDCMSLAKNYSSKVKVSSSKMDTGAAKNATSTVKMPMS